MRKTFLTILSTLFFTAGIVFAQSIALPLMVSVEGGTFQMGDELKIGDRDELPLHDVTVSSFHMSKYPITVAQYRTFCDETKRDMPEEPRWGWEENAPIVNVSWFDAIDYTEWLSRKTGKSYRLPTEAEWEFAARGGNMSKGFKYSGGRVMGLVGRYSENSIKKTYVAGGKAPNELGLYDMSGNVWEWCNDWYGSNYYNGGAKTDPKGPSSGLRRVLRGGSWRNEAEFCRIANRNSCVPDFRYDYGGFRVVF